MATKRSKKSNKRFSTLAIRSAQKSLNGFLKKEEQISLAISNCLEEITTLEAKKDPVFNFSIQRKKNQLKVEEGKLKRVQRLRNDSEITFHKYLDTNASIDVESLN